MAITPNQQVQVRLTERSRGHFVAAGYPFRETKVRRFVTVKACDLMSGSSVVVEYRCDDCSAVNSAKYFTLAAKSTHRCRACAQRGKTPPNKVVFSEEQQRYILNLYQDEWLSPDAIAKLLDLSGPTIRKFLKAEGVWLGRRAKRPNCECPVCDAKFRRCPSDLKPINYCSRQCAARARELWDKRLCLTCDADFLVKPHESRQYCSSTCWYQANTRGAWTTCLTCGERVWSTPGQPRSFCSRSCSGEAQKTGTQLPCTECGELRYIPECHQRGDYFFCSVPCFFTFKKTNEDYRTGVQEKAAEGLRRRWREDVEWANRQRISLGEAALKRMQTQSRKGSKLEDKVVAMLDDLEITYNRWKCIRTESGVKEYDVYLPETDNYLEIHGGFWHADERLYPDRTQLRDVQRRNIQNDVFKAQLIADMGKRLYILWEHDIHKDEAQVREQLKRWFS
jgi:G:T-mismatch repair DNA endonuclease (very short patch repair protein)